MNTLKERMLTNWHLMRIIRLGFGIMLLIAGIQSKDWLMGLFSVIFLYQAITDTGCCGARGCAPTRTGGVPNAGTKAGEETIEYEEIK